MSETPGTFSYTKGRMSSNLVEALVVRLLACPALFHEARGLLKPEHFDGSEVFLSVVWAAAVRAYDQFGRLSEDTLAEIAEETLTDSGEDISAEEFANIFDTDSDRPGIIRWALNGVDVDGLDLDQGRHLLRRFLEERVVMGHLRNALDMSRGGVPSNLPAILEHATRQQEQIHGIREDPVELGIPDEWRPAALQVNTTGIPFLDVYMDGGQAPGEVYGILGPFGVGKTTLGIQMCVEQCRVLADRAAENDEAPGQVYFFSYEQAASQIRSKALACAAHINMSTMNSFTGEDCLSRSGDLKDYEIEMFTRAGTINSDPPPPGEYERFIDVKDMLQTHLRIVDLSGSSKSRDGSGYVDEIAAILENDVARNAAAPKMVLIDHVWLAAYRALHAEGIDESKLRHKITMFADSMKRQVAERFNLSAWLLHQYNGAANKMSPAKLLHHTAAAESASFAMALAFCFCIGNKDDATNTARMACTKRRRAGDPQEPAILFINGGISTIEDRTDRFTVMSDRILSKDVAEQFAGGDEDSQAPPLRGARSGLDGAGIWGPGM